MGVKFWGQGHREGLRLCLSGCVLLSLCPYLALFQGSFRDPTTEKIHGCVLVREPPFLKVRGLACSPGRRLLNIALTLVT